MACYWADEVVRVCTRAHVVVIGVPQSSRHALERGSQAHRPDLNRLVLATAGQSCAIIVPCHRCHPVIVKSQENKSTGQRAKSVLGAPCTNTTHSKKGHCNCEKSARHFVDFSQLQCPLDGCPVSDMERRTNLFHRNRSQTSGKTYCFKCPSRVQQRRFSDEDKLSH